jgi:excisionase family DNA binding protein
MAMLTVEDLERESKVSKYTWRAWIREGKVPVVRIGRRVRVKEEDYRQFIAESRTPAREARRIETGPADGTAAASR